MGARNTSGVRKTLRGGKPHWIIDFRYVDKNGRLQRYRRDATLQTSAGARGEADRLRVKAVVTGTLEVRDASLTFIRFVEGDFTALFMPKYRPATRVRYEALLRQGLLGALGSLHLDQIGPAEIRGYAARLIARGVQPKGPITLLRTVLRAALELGVIETLPSFPRIAQSRKLLDAPGEGEVEALLGGTRAWLHTAVALAAYGGLRMGEVRALEVRDVDFVKDCIHVRHALSEEVLLTPKSGHERLVPLCPELRRILTEATRSKLPRARIVVNAKGGTPRRQHVLTKLKAQQVRLALPERSFHSLRHFFCSTLIRRGASVEAVRLLAGHSDLATTQRYVHAGAADLRSAIATLG
ncbi:MAG: site-specific integrase [Polyangiales bacterium]